MPTKAMDAEFRSESYSPDNLIAGDEPSAQAFEILLITGQNLTRGAVLGRITASGKYNLSLSAAVDGSEVPAAILAADVDATAADKKALAYFRGVFNEDRVTIGTAHTVASIKQALRARQIFLVPPVTNTPV